VWWKVAKQQTTGPLQLPLNNCGVMALDYLGKEGVGLHRDILRCGIDPAAGSRTAIAEALSNIVGTYQKWYGRIILRLTGCGL
jgi:phosphoribosylformylglycinamidine synthase